MSSVMKFPFFLDFSKNHHSSAPIRDQPLTLMHVTFTSPECVLNIWKFSVSSWMSPKYIMNVTWMSLECIMNVTWMSPKCVLNILKYFRKFLIVFWMKHKCIVNITWMNHKCHLNVLHMSPECAHIFTLGFLRGLKVWRTTKNSLILYTKICSMNYP